MINTSAQSLLTAKNSYQKLTGVTASQVIVWLLLTWANSTALAAAPVLTPALGSNITWTSAITPPVWNIYYSTNGGTSYVLGATAPGTSTGFFTMQSNGTLCYIQGYTAANGVPTTQPSNVVSLT